MFKRVLIANRGEIAVRIIRACEELDIETVAIFSEADENALHVQLADHAVCVGSADATDSYLNKDSILRAARSRRAPMPSIRATASSRRMRTSRSRSPRTASPGLARCRRRIRPCRRQDAARASGRAAVSGILMAKGSEPLKNNKEAIKMAKEVGYPVILKPVSGGGGKGMYVAHDEDAQGHSSTSRRRTTTSSITSSVRATSKSRLSPITTARSSTSASASAPSSAATRSSSRSPRRSR